MYLNEYFQLFCYTLNNISIFLRNPYTSCSKVRYLLSFISKTYFIMFSTVDWVLKSFYGRDVCLMNLRMKWPCRTIEVAFGHKKCAFVIKEENLSSMYSRRMGFMLSQKILGRLNTKIVLNLVKYSWKLKSEKIHFLNN